jgi:2-iminobutanoate/2-iminopropanoate deaminase
VSNKQTITTPNGQPPVGPYSPAILSGNLLFLSGQIALDAATGQLINDSIEAEAHKVMQNVGALLQAAGANYQHLVKVTIYLTDMANFATVNQVYASYFQDGVYPARETIGISQLPRAAQVEISGIAVLPA